MFFCKIHSACRKFVSPETSTLEVTNDFCYRHIINKNQVSYWTWSFNCLWFNGPWYKIVYSWKESRSRTRCSYFYREFFIGSYLSGRLQYFLFDDNFSSTQSVLKWIFQNSCFWPSYFYLLSVTIKCYNWETQVALSFSCWWHGCWHCLQQ